MVATQEYYKLSADEICSDINQLDQETLRVQIEGIDLSVDPHVYPSHKFRSTGFMLKNFNSLVRGKKICDMGCGPGIVGLFCLINGADQVVQADINPFAVANAKKNNKIHGFEENKIKTYLSNCFDNIPKSKFDLIIFPMPFHSDCVEINDPLQYAFNDPGFVSIKKFLTQAPEYCHQKTQIFIIFSNKGDVNSLEKIFEENHYKWNLWKVTNTDQQYDNRIYLLTQGT